MATAEELTLNIYNAALAMVGTQLLSSPKADNAQGFACRAFGGVSYNRAHTRVPWNFAMMHTMLLEADGERVSLGQGQGMVWRWPKPDDYLRGWTWAGSRTPSGVVVTGNVIEGRCYPPVTFTYMRKVPVTEVSDTFIEIVQVLLAEAIKPRFEKTKVNADALTLRQITGLGRELIREAQSIELAQIPQPELLGAEMAGRGFGYYTRRTRDYDSW